MEIFIVLKGALRAVYIHEFRVTNFLVRQLVYNEYYRSNRSSGGDCDKRNAIEPRSA